MYVVEEERAWRWRGGREPWSTGRAELDGLKARLAPALGRAETRAAAGAFIGGLLGPAERKTGWMLAEQAGMERPHRIQSLLGRGRWPADALRDRVRACVAEALGCEAGVLVVDETGFLKKGMHSVGVARQYSGTAGRVENCQVGVFAAYASRWGQALVDRRLRLPKAWAEDAARRAKAFVPEETTLATKPAIAGSMLADLLDAGLPVRWVLADALCGSDFRLRWMLEARGQPYVLAVRSNQSVKFLEGWLPVLTDPAAMAAAIPEEDWHTLAAGEGAKGPRLCCWARLPLRWITAAGFERWLLIRRSRHDPEAMAFYFACAPEGTSLAELAAAGGLRWSIEQAFQHARDDLGLDHCEARSWHGWHRHTTLVVAAAAYLAKLSADRRRHAFAKEDKTSPNVAAA